MKVKKLKQIRADRRRLHLLVESVLDKAKLDMPGVLHLEVTMKWKKSRHDDSDQETQKQLAQSSAAPAVHVSGFRATACGKFISSAVESSCG